VSRTRTRGGIIVLVAVTLLSLGALVAVTRFPALWRPGVEFRARFHTAAGLQRGAEVRYGGIGVGTVTDVRLDPERPTRVEVRFKVREGTPVRVDTRATIAPLGVLGEPHLALDAGREDAPPLAAGRFVTTDEPVALDVALRKLAALIEHADTLLDVADTVLRSVDPGRVARTMARMDTLLGNATVQSERIFTRVDRTFGRVERTFGQLDTTFASVDRATARLDRILERTDRLVTVIDTTVTGTSSGIGAIQRDASGTLRELRALVTDLRDAVDAGGGTEQLVQNLVILTDNLARLTTSLERDPSSVLRSRRPLPKSAGPPPRDE
jgi:phospholipid/cholesterol/gamma-HCH transport system substrate-binding protein